MSPSKKAQADAAYERQEDQRALVKILAAAEEYALGFDVVLSLGGADRALEIVEAIARVKAAFLRVEAPVAKPEPSVAGQINIDGTIESCPQCGVPEVSWSILPLDGTTIDEQARVQCGMCACIFPISFTQYNAIVAERRRTIGESDKRVERHLHQKRVRGAG
jgi:hypothetical protein